jgi:hypothetical protein
LNAAVDADLRGHARRTDAVGLAVVALPVLVGLASTLRALWEFAWGGPIYGPGAQPWAAGEWVISYAGGFVRRGLGGEILLPFAELTGSVGAPFLAVTAGAAVFVAAAVLRLYAGSGRTEAALMLVLPTSVLFPLWDYNVAGRKEQLVLVLACALALASRRGDVALATPRGALAAGIVGAVLMFLNEGLVFFLPLVFVLLEVRRSGAEPVRDVLLRAAAMLGPPGLAVAGIALAAGPIDTAPLFAAVPGDGPGMKAWCDARGIGSICWLGFPTSFVIGYVYNIGFEGIVRALAIVAVEAALVTALWWRLLGPSRSPRAGLLLAFGWLALAPLYFVAFDWGRWTAAATMLFVILAPVDRPQRPFPAWKTAAAAVVLSVFTISHMQSVSFEIGGPRLVRDALAGIGIG